MVQPDRFGRYLLLSKLATGGMAEIFLAKFKGAAGFEKEVVIKKILPQWSSDGDFISMLIDEAKISVQLGHPNIIQVYELGREGETYYMAMEYLQGVDLRQLLHKAQAKNKKIPLEVSLTLARDLLEGLAYAHSKKDSKGLPLGIVHRDISPQNILVSFDGTTKITDFGIAKAASRSQETMAGVLKGKFAYMSPEQANQEALDHRSDLFSAAVVLYETTTGERLFYRGSDLDTLDRVRRGQIVFSPKAEKILPSRLKEILQKALVKEKVDRYPDAAAFRDEIVRFARRSKKELRRETVASFVTDLFADELSTKKEEVTRLLAETTVTSFFPENLVTPGEKEVIVRSENLEAPTEIVATPRFPRELVAGLLVGLTAVILMVVFLKRGPKEKEPLALEETPVVAPAEDRLIPPEVIPSVAEKDQVIPARVDLPTPQKNPEEVKKGFLSVQAIPWGYVTIDDGKKRWETPVRRIPLKAGRHVVRVLYEPEGSVVTSQIDLAASRETICLANFLKGEEIRCGN